MPQLGIEQTEALECISYNAEAASLPSAVKNRTSRYVRAYPVIR